jgi:integrase
MQAWTFQDRKQLDKLNDACPWSVGWYDPDGKRKSKSIGSKSLAEKFARKIEGQLAAGVYQASSKATWQQFVDEYRARIVEPMPVLSRECVELALKHFAAIVKPAKLSGIKTQTVDEFIAERRKATGRKGQPLSPATINRDLRHLKAAFRVAHEWGYMPVVPKVRMVREQEKLARFVTDEHFAAMYEASVAAKFPAGLPYSPAEWWRGMLTFAYMTGWRIREWPGTAPSRPESRRRHGDYTGRRQQRRTGRHRAAGRRRPRSRSPAGQLPPGRVPVALSRTDAVGGVQPHSECRRYQAAMRSRARAHRRLPPLRLSRSTAGLRHAERPGTVSRCLAKADAAQELRDDAALHQHGRAVVGRRGSAAHARRVEGPSLNRFGRLLECQPFSASSPIFVSQ